jgi:hypothetical protein
MFHQDIGNENVQVNFGISHSTSMLLGVRTHQCLGYMFRRKKAWTPCVSKDLSIHKVGSPQLQIWDYISPTFLYHSYKRPTWKINSPMNTCHIQHINHSLVMCCIHFISCFSVLYYSINVGVLGTPLLEWTMTKDVDAKLVVTSIGHQDDFK